MGSGGAQRSVGARIETLPFGPNYPADEEGTPEARTTAVGLFHYGESYRDCAERLADEPPAGLIFEAPIEFLYFHAMELYLKAFLRANGLTVAEVRKLGHNHYALQAECIERGLVLSRYPEAFFDFVDQAEVMATRYIATGAVAKPSIGALRKVCTEIRHAVREALISGGHPVRGWRAG